MKTVHVWVVAAAVALAGCVSKKAAQREAQSSFLAGQQQGASQQTPVVLVRGEVRRPVIPFREGMTLAEAVADSDYHGLREPRTLVLTRQGSSVVINVRQLLQGRDNIELQPGDVIELRR